MKLSANTRKPAKRTAADAAQADGGQRRLKFLVAALLACTVALPVTHYTLFRKPAPPPPSAGNEAHLRYWRERIKSDVSDIQAYIRLGTLEERSGFYMSAVKRLRAARALGAPDSAVSGPLGRALTQLARDDEALPELEKAARLAPNNLDAAANLAGLYISQDDPESARTVLKRFMDSAPGPIKSADDAQRLAMAFLECGDNRLALSMARRAAELAPEDLTAHGIAARSAMTLKDYPTARRHLEAMLAQNADDVAVLYLYGLVLEAQGDEEQALKQWQKAVSLNPAAIDAYEKIGNAYARKKDMRRAAAAFEIVARSNHSQETAVEAAGAFSHIKDPTPDERAKSAYWQAVAAGFHGDFETALRFGKAAAAHPATKRAGLLAMAEAYRGMRRKEPYLAVMRQVTAPGTVDDLVLMASAYDQADEHVRREEYLRRALAKAATPEHQADIHVTLAQAYRDRGMRDEAERELEEALEKNPRAAAIQRQLAELLFERRTLGGRLAKAVRAWESAVALDPDHEADWQNLGRAYMAQGETVKAIRALEHAIDLEPGFGAAYLELGRAYARLGDQNSSKHALELYSRFVAYDQERQTLSARARRPNPAAGDLIAYGDFLRKTGYVRDAVTQYEMALALRPKDERLRSKLDALYRRLNIKTASGGSAQEREPTG